MGLRWMKEKESLCWKGSLWDAAFKGRNAAGGNQDGEGCRRDGDT